MGKVGGKFQEREFMIPDDNNMHLLAARKHIQTFFEGKLPEKEDGPREKRSVFFGGPINFGNPDASYYLFTDKNIRLVAFISWDDATELAYLAMIDPINQRWREKVIRESSGEQKKSIRNLGIDTHKWLEIMSEVEKLNIPKEYVGGIALIYLELCEGVNYK